MSKQFCCENTEKTDNLILYYNFNFEVMSSNSTYYESSALRKSNSATLRFFFEKAFLDNILKSLGKISFWVLMPICQKAFFCTSSLEF